MKIAVDGGGLCTAGDRRYGNYVTTREILTALSRKKSEHLFRIYSFCPNLSPIKNLFRGQGFIYRKLLPKKFWMSLRVSLEEALAKNDIFLALNQALPLYTPAKKITISHGQSFFYFPKYYTADYKTLMRNLEFSVRHSDLMIVSSIRIKKELNEIFPDFKKIKVMPFGIPAPFLKLPEKNRKKSPHLLYVGMDYPVKNLSFVIRSFLELIGKREFNKYRLILVGVSKSYEQLSKQIKVIPYLESEKLRDLYESASALVTASHYESFNLPVLEALSQNCPVIGLRSSIIPEFDDYVNVVTDPEDFTREVMSVLAHGGKKIDGNRLRRTFSWDSYVELLIQYCYEAIGGSIDSERGKKPRRMP